MISNLVFEWRRASSLRSTWGFPLLAILVAGLFTVLAIVATDSAGGEAVTLVDALGSAANPFSVVLATTICAQAFGHDYRDGTMRLVLSEYPVRTRVFWAKLIVPAMFVAGSVVASVAAVTVLMALLKSLASDAGAAELVALVARQVVLGVWWGLMVAAITALIRNLAAGIVAALVLAGLLESLLVALIGSKLPWLSDVMPFSSALRWAATGAVQPGLVSMVWVAVAVGAAWALFVRRDT